MGRLWKGQGTVDDNMAKSVLNGFDVCNATLAKPGARHYRTLTAGCCLALGIIAVGNAVAAPENGRYIHVRLERIPAILSIAELEAFAGGDNVAKGRPAFQSTVGYGGVPARAVDGNTNPDWGSETITHTDEGRKNSPQWWEVDLGKNVEVSKIVLHNRKGYSHRSDGVQVLLLDERRRVVRGKTFADAGPLVLEMDLATEACAECAGEEIEDVTVPPATPAEIRAAYEKRATWVDSVAATAAKLRRYQTLLPLIDRLVEDFPDHAEEIVGNLGSGNFSKAELMKGAPKLASTSDESKLLALETLKWFNAAAMERAIRAYSAKYPSAYGDPAALLARLAEVKKSIEGAANEETRLNAAAALMKLQDDLFLRHPAVDFTHFLMVKRSRKSHSGLPHNWQGNSSVPLEGYLNAIVSLPIRRGTGERGRTIAASNYFLGDVDLDFDADKIAYSGGLDSEKRWCVLETRLDKPLVKTLKTPSGMNDIDCYDPCYLPDGRMLFVSTSGFHGVPCVTGSDYVGNTHLLEKDGGVKRLVFDQDNSWCPVVMNNGRVLYLRWEYTDSAHYFSRVMMTMNVDGSDQKAFYGSNSYWPNSLFYARPLPGSVTKFCGIASGHHGCAREGELVLFDVMKGRNETEGVIQRIPGWGKPVANKARDQLVNGSSPRFLHPYPLADELFLTSVHRGNGDPFIVAFADIYDNIVPVCVSADWNCLEPLPIKKRSRPQMSVDRRNDAVDTCTVYLQNVNFGAGLKGVPNNVAKKLRLFSYSYSPRNVGGHYNIGFEGPWDIRNILGEVELEKDGSAIFTVPANTPFAIQPLDSNGCKLQEMRSWFVGVPGEVISCTGCHENQNEAPPAANSIAARKRPQTPAPWYGPRRNYAFLREVQPVLDRKCVGCHNPNSGLKTRMGAPLPDFDGSKMEGHYSRAYVNLMPYVRRNGPEGDYHLLTPLEFHVSTSELYQRLEKGHHNVKLTAEEWSRIVTWMDLNVPFWGTWTEETGGNQRTQMNLARRKEMALKWAGDKYDPEKIGNPYVPGTERFEAPPAGEKSNKEIKVEGWPFAATRAKEMQGENKPRTLDIGSGEQLEFAYIPAGSFAMGSNELTPAERPVCKATIGKGFWMATKEITQGQFRLMDPNFDNGVYDKHYKDQVNRGYYMGGRDPDFAQPGNEKFPAIRVSWDMAQQYCAWLSKRLGRKVRLPTEAEWEWACRAGTDTEFNYGTKDDDFSKHENMADYMFIELAVVGVNPQPFARGDDPQPKNLPPALWDYELRDRRFNDHVLHLAKVGSYAPNVWGLYDMHGNVAEWTSSPWRSYPYDEKTADGDLKVVRGGSWYRRPVVSSSAWRWRYPSWMRPFDVGFRVVVEDLP